MQTFAFVDFGMCRQLFTTELEVEQFAPPDQLWVDVTHVEPKPEWGWPWDGSVFTQPPPPYVDPRPAIIAELDQIDRASARPLRALIISEHNVGSGTPERAELEALELRAADLRAQLAALDDE